MATAPDQKVALVTGITGQDGAYLAELLLEKGYVVHGIRRRSSGGNTGRIDRLCRSPQPAGGGLVLHHGDLGDPSSLIRIIQESGPDEIYNLGAMSDVAVSFAMPEYTADVNALGTLRLLEAIRILGLEKKTRFYQASTSELYGLAQETPQRETTPFYPRSPYAVAKLYAYWITVNYREAYGMYACNGMLFNHESPLRGENFVSRRITRGLARVALGLQRTLSLGCLDARRDWGHARDYACMQWLMLQQDEPEDFVIATGVQHSVREFVETAARELGIVLEWRGKGPGEHGVAALVRQEHAPAVRRGQVIVTIDPLLYRPSEVPSLQGDANKASAKLGWSPSIPFDELVREMVRHDLGVSRLDARADAPISHQSKESHLPPAWPDKRPFRVPPERHLAKAV